MWNTILGNVTKILFGIGIIFLFVKLLIDRKEKKNETQNLLENNFNPIANNL